MYSISGEPKITSLTLKAIFIFFMVLLSHGLVGCEHSTGRQTDAAKVTRVVDGDTIVVSVKGAQYKVRLIGINTPERGRPYYKEATEKTEELVLGKEVRLEKDVSETDKYGRLLRYVYAGDLFVNAELVKQGYAQQYTYPPDVKYADLFRKLAREARENELGLWGPEEAAPADESEAQSTGSSKAENRKLIGNIKSKIYHQPDCSSVKKIKPENATFLNSTADAESAGYRPCKICLSRD